MPLGSRPVCTRCKNTESTMWRKGTEGEVLCNYCGVKKLNGNGSEGKSDSESSKSSGKVNISSGQQCYIGPVRKSARLKPSKYKGQYNPKALATKGKSRRVIFKKNPIKAPAPVSTVITQDYIFYEGQYWQLGDIVSVMDHEGGIFYAQIKGFLCDQYCEKSAIITWLLPTTGSPAEGFDASSYIIGPEEELPRSMDCFEFVCHAPSEYFRAKYTPYPVPQNKPDLAYIWTSLGPEIRPTPTQEEIFGLKDGENRPLMAKGGKGGKGRGKGKGIKVEKVEKMPLEIKEEIKEEIP